MTLKQLRYFVEIIDSGNITEAANHLNVAQTAVGQQIRKLEDVLGVSLLTRHSRGVSPTLQGQRLYDKAREILMLADETFDQISAVGHRPTLVSLGITPSIARLIGPEIALAAGTKLQNTRLHLVEELSFVLIEALHRREIDYALAYEVGENARLHRVPLIEEQLLFIEPAGSRGARPIAFKDAIASELALNGSRDVVWRIIHSTAKRLSLPVNTAFEVQSVEAIKTLVSRGVATSVMPYGVVAEELQKGTLVGRPIVRPSLTRSLFLAHYPEPGKPSAPQDFLLFLDSLTDLLLESIGPLANRISNFSR